MSLDRKAGYRMDEGQSGGIGTILQPASRWRGEPTSGLASAAPQLPELIRALGAFRVVPQSGCEQSQQTAQLIDHLIGGHEKGLRQSDTERLCGLEVDHQLELGWL